MEPREKLQIVTMSEEIQERANKIFCLYLPSTDVIQECTNIVYCNGKSYRIGNWNKTERTK